jgi:hypothetical protein
MTFDPVIVFEINIFDNLVLRVHDTLIKSLFSKKNLKSIL